MFLNESNEHRRRRRFGCWVIASATPSVPCTAQMSTVCRATSNLSCCSCRKCYARVGGNSNAVIRRTRHSRPLLFDISPFHRQI
jgi:hypothetical protein